MKLFSFVVVLLAGLALISCEQPEEALVICETDAPVASVADFHRLFTPPTQSFTVAAAQAHNIRLLDGSMLFVPPDAFGLPTGGAANGNVEVRVQALTKPADMVLGGLATMSFWRPLESGAQFHITAWQNGAPLRLQPGKRLTFSIPKAANASLTGMLQWTGINVGSGNMTWVQDSVRVGLDGQPGGQQYYQTRVWSDTLGWYNIARLWTSSPSDTTLLRADVAADPAAKVYLLPTQRAGAFTMKWNPQTHLMELYGVPVGTDLQVVMLRVVNGQLLVGASHTVVRRGAVFRPALAPMSPQDAADFIRQL